MILTENRDDYSKKATYVLTCDGCGRYGRRGTFSECKRTVKTKGWKLLCVATVGVSGQDALMAVLCAVCQSKETLIRKEE